MSSSRPWKLYVPGDPGRCPTWRFTLVLGCDVGTVPSNTPLSSCPLRYTFRVCAAASYTPATWYHVLTCKVVAPYRPTVLVPAAFEILNPIVRGPRSTVVSSCD